MTSEHPAADERGEEDPALDVAVIGGGQAGLAIGQLLARPGPAPRDLRGRRGGRLGVAGPVGLARPIHPAALRRAPGHGLPRRPGRLPDRDEVVAYLEAYARRFALPVVTDHPCGRCAPARAGDSCSDRSAATSRPPRWSWRRGRSRRRTRRRSPPASSRRSSRSTAPAIAAPRTCPPGACWSSAAATPASRSRRSWRRPARSTLAIGTRQTPLPQRLLGRDLFWWLTRTGRARQDRRFAHRAPRCATATR